MFFENLLRKYRFRYNQTRIKGTLREDLRTFMTISCWIILRMRNVPDKSCRESPSAFLCSITLFWKLCCLWDNVEKFGRTMQATDDNIQGYTKWLSGVLTTCCTQYTWDRSMCVFLFNRTTLQVFVTYLISALYLHPLWFCESEPPLKPSPLTCYKQFGMNSIIVLMFVESQRVHI